MAVFFLFIIKKLFWNLGIKKKSIRIIKIVFFKETNINDKKQNQKEEKEAFLTSTTSTKKAKNKNKRKKIIMICIIVVFLIIASLCLLQQHECMEVWLNKKCNRIIDGCTFEPFYVREGNKLNMMVCRHLSLSRSFNSSMIDVYKSKNCTMGDTFLFFQPSRPSEILDASFDVEQAFTLTRTLFGWYFIYFANLKGLAIDMPPRTHLERIYSQRLAIDIYSSRFVFYQNGSEIKKGCESLLNTATKKSIINLISPQNILEKLNLRKLEFKYPICPVIFNNTYIKLLLVSHLVDTFYRRNVLSFDKNNNNNNSHNNFSSYFIVISDLYLPYVLNIDLNEALVDPSVFKFTRSMTFSGEIASIREGLFKSFTSLDTLTFDAFFWRRLAHKQRFDWLNNDLNNRVTNVNVDDLSQSTTSIRDELKDRYFLLKIDNIIEKEDINQDDLFYSQVFPHADFCLYRHFPFEKLVILVFDVADPVKSNFTTCKSCTYMFLIRFYGLYDKLSPREKWYRKNGDIEFNQVLLKRWNSKKQFFALYF